MFNAHVVNHKPLRGHMHHFQKLHKPSPSADASCQAEYHRLAAQQLELFKLNVQFQRLPECFQSILLEKLAVHRRSIKFYASRARFTPCALVSPDVSGTGLATHKQARGTIFPKGKAAAYVTQFISQ